MSYTRPAALHPRRDDGLPTKSRDQHMNTRDWVKGIGQRAIAGRALSIAASGRNEVAWKLYVEHKVKPLVQFYEKKPHPSKASALKRALAIYRNPGWRLNVLFIEGSNGERRGCRNQRVVRARAKGRVRPATRRSPMPWSVKVFAECIIIGNAQRARARA